jgi:hypothetical protein
MSAITIKDLSLDVELDRKAMATICGGNSGQWVLGAFQPFVETVSRTPGSIINLFQSNTFQSNTYYMADRMTNQVLSINGSNNGPVTVVGITG